MCQKWMDGLCYDKKCKNRHMFIKVCSISDRSYRSVKLTQNWLSFVRPSIFFLFHQKNRSRIPCFFETQPNGCKKTHCVFKHNQNDGDTGDNKHKQDALSESGVVEDVSVGDTSNWTTAWDYNDIKWISCAVAVLYLISFFMQVFLLQLTKFKIFFLIERKYGEIYLPKSV